MLFTPGVRKVLETLNQAGYEAYVVGGAVRDMLLGRVPKEFDVCTDACPKAVLELAAANGIKAYRKGVAFGVVSWLLEGEEIEIATFRTELYGTDSHRPEKVTFVWALEDDLARRDFTVNAMAMDRRGNLVDPLGGREDLERGLLRAVGDPGERFAEDALRLFRACRFVAEYGFTLEEKTKDAMPRATWRVAGLSVERVRDELEKILVAEHAVRGLIALQETGLLATTCRARGDGREESVPVMPEIARLAGIAQNPRHHCSDVWGHTLAVVNNVPPVPVLRWAALLHDVGKGLPGVRGRNREGQPSDYGHAAIGWRIARDILQRLRLPPSLAERAAWLVREHMGFPKLEEENVLRWLRRLAADFSHREQLAEAVGQLLALRRADTLGLKVNPEPVLEQTDRLGDLVEALLRRLPFFQEDLAISGGDAARIVGRGPQVKQVLEDLVLRVQSGELPNRAEDLRRALEKKTRRGGGEAQSRKPL